MGSSLSHCKCICSTSNGQEGEEVVDDPIRQDIDIVKTKSKEGGFARHNLIITTRGGRRIDDYYTIKGETIGAGADGVVKKAINKKTNAVCAVKGISKSKMQPDHINYEINLMTILDHPNIIKLYETFEDARNVYLVMELCAGGELFDRIMANSKSGFSEKVVAKLAKQMVGAVLYMHKVNIAHRDLKPENFLFADERPMSESSLKLVDFGASKQFEKGAYMATKVFTLDYVAPEVFAGKYTEACDVWSLGVIIYFLLSGHHPFHPRQNKKRKGGVGGKKYQEEQIRSRVMNGVWDFNLPVWSSVSADGKDLISKMLFLDPEQRFTSEQVMSHKWLHELAPNAIESTLSADAFNNLQAFRAENNLKKAAVTVIAQQLPEEKIKNLREMFCALDKNGDGTISVEEMNTGLKEMGVEDAELQSMLNQIMQDVDSDGSGAIDFSEFLGAAVDEHHYIQEDLCWSSFRVFDIDGNGQITKDELAQMLSDGHCKKLQEAFDVDQAEIEKVMADVDKDGNERIDFEEFLAMMREHEGRHMKP